MELPEAAVTALGHFEELLRSYAIPRGLIARGDEEHLIERHLRDSLRALPALGPGDRAGVDLGSGAGLPGIPIAIADPELDVVLAEVRRTRVAFLELAVAQLELENASVYGGRVESLTGAFDVAFARGFGDIRASWRSAEPLLAPGGRLLYWAGTTFDRAEDPPENVQVGAVAEPALESWGPIVIMARP
ncbi:MAG TPA: RsmG family class I SAM-dependent methyltransferase [Actinomycetota bacterium]|nr:RsmG family class I SAM-dependent methyltransferase [Actinomycetota bacterium]